MACELREASWSAPVLWRFGKAGWDARGDAKLFNALLTRAPTALAAGARASARFNVHYGEALEMFMRLLLRKVRRYECRAPQAAGAKQFHFFDDE
jgi:hypothetical protein